MAYRNAMGILAVKISMAIIHSLNFDVFITPYIKNPNMHNKLTGTPKTISRYPAKANPSFFVIRAPKRQRVPIEKNTPNTALPRSIISESFIIIYD